MAAIIARKKLVPVGSFGGASLRLLEALEDLGKQEFRVLSGTWGNHVLRGAALLMGLGQEIELLLIHGRSDDRLKLENWLSRNNLKVKITVMQEELMEGKAMPDKFEALARTVHGAIALATGDDRGGLAGAPDCHPRARQNVWVEFGWFWGKLGKEKVLLLHEKDVEIPSDLDGLERLEYTNSPAERSDHIRKFLEHLRARV